jgi:hypothetical protein
MNSIKNIKNNQELVVASPKGDLLDISNEVIKSSQFEDLDTAT